MTEADEKKIRELLRQNLRPADQELRRDLWPQMLARMQERSTTVPWFDWALIAALVVWLFLVPRAIPVLLYHL